MLRITKSAADLIRTLVTRDATMPEGGGLRIATNPSTRALSMSLARTSEATDVVVVGHGAQLFLTALAAERLDERTLNAEVAAGRPAFFLDR